MTNQDFIDKINAYRDKSKSLIEGNGGYLIERGMARTISSYVEELFALFIAKRIGRKDLRYFVDKVTSFRIEKGEKAESFKPDVSIIDRNEMTHYFDLKTNMGWKREFVDYLKEKNQFIEKLKSSEEVWIPLQGRKKDFISIDNNLVFQMVVVDGGNINQELLSERLEKAKEYDNVKVYVLYAKNEFTGQFELNEKAFVELFNCMPK